MPEGALPKGGWFICFCLGFIAGVALYTFINDVLVLVLILLGIVALLCFIVFYLKNKLKIAIGISFCFLGVIIGLSRYGIAVHSPTKLDIDYYLNEVVEFEGQIISEPVLKKQTVEIDVKANKFLTGQSVKGVVRLRTNPFPQFFYGDHVKIKCKLQQPENTEFNYQRYLARYNIYSLCFNARLSNLDINSVGPLAYLMKFKSAALDLIKVNVGEPESSLIGPVIFGGGEEIDDDIVNIFRRTGLTHIMAVSGFNVGILAFGLGYILFALGLKRKLVFVMTSFSIVIYVILVAWPASAVRAGIMSIFIIYSLAIGRLARIINIIIITATGTLMINPFLLAADIGWQLSFLALLSLIYLQAPLNKFLEKIFFYLTVGRSKLTWLSQILSATLAAQIGTTPVTLYNFGQVSLISPLANVLVVWLIPVFTAVTIMALPLAALFPFFGNIIFLPSYFMAKYIIWIVGLLSKITWAIWSIDF